MNHQTSFSADAMRGAMAPAFVSIQTETRTAVDTRTAAHHLNRAEQTLRMWACRENGPLRPIRINGRLAWSVANIRQLLGVA